MTDINIRLTKTQLKDLSEGDSISLHILPPTLSRMEKTVEGFIHKGNFPQEVKELVLAWNESDFIRIHATSDPRNNPITDEQIKKNKNLFIKALREISLEAILAIMGKYFAACKTGRHLWDEKNHGYSHLGGFIRRVLDCHLNKQKYWWTNTTDIPIKDDHPKLTRKVANMYAKRFLGRGVYGLKNPSREYGSFMIAADHIIMKSKNLPFSKEEFIEVLLDCIELSRDKNGIPVSPGRLSSELTWQNYMPQHVQSILT